MRFSFKFLERKFEKLTAFSLKILVHKQQICKNCLNLDSRSRLEAWNWKKEILVLVSKHKLGILVLHCIRAPPKQGTFSHHQFFYREWIRKSFPVDREGLTVLKSILPCWWGENEWYDHISNTLLRKCVGKYCSRDSISWYRGAKSPPKGNLKVREGCISQCIPPLGSVRIRIQYQYRLKGLHRVNPSHWIFLDVNK